MQERFGVGRACLVADPGLISEKDTHVVEWAGCDWIVATRLHQRTDVASVLDQAHAANDQDWTEVEKFGLRVLDLEPE